ncbi:hypothetical protein MHK_000661 [Candidatus Magnetomorum sp. HK-1]|nr:hypothetical protein MHK_000661 [Candidatus Magnetomorum sp. HK-1]
MKYLLKLWIIWIALLIFNTEPVFSQQIFKFPQSIKYNIHKNGKKTNERSIFTFTEKGRYTGTANSTFKFIDKKKNTNEIHTYLKSLDYSYLSSSFLSNSKRNMEIKVAHGKGFDQSDTMMIQFQTDKRSGFEPLCKSLLFIDLNTALIISSHATCLNLPFSKDCYYYSFTDNKIKLAKIEIDRKETVFIKGKKVISSVFKIQTKHDDEEIDIFIYNDSKGYFIPAIISWKNLNIKFSLDQIIF